ncbi:TPA: antirestriction protein ArdA [Legionella pneumophila]
MDTPYIYVACLASYNSGILHGKWIDAFQDPDLIYDEIYQMLRESPVDIAEDYAIHDYEGFLNIEISEFESILNVAEIADFVIKYGELGAQLCNEYSMEDAEKFLEECYQGSYDSEVDFARAYFDDCYSNEIPENLLFYIDYESFARDLFINDYVSVESNGQTHVFCYF